MYLWGIFSKLSGLLLHWNFEWCHQGNDLTVHCHTSFEKSDKWLYVQLLANWQKIYSLALFANIYTNYPVVSDRIYVYLQYLADQYNAIRLHKPLFSYCTKPSHHPVIIPCCSSILANSHTKIVCILLQILSVNLPFPLILLPSLSTLSFMLFLNFRSLVPYT